jgi:hypothetical protein
MRAVMTIIRTIGSGTSAAGGAELAASAMTMPVPNRAPAASPRRAPPRAP